MASRSMWDSLKNEVELLNLYPFLSKVAIDNPMPVPGYLFHEINALTYIQDGANCRQLVEYFMKRLQNESPVVKLKVLKMILHLVQNGHRRVSEEVQYHEMLLKQTAGLAFPVNSAYPKSHYEAIRKLSAEILQTAFSESQIQDPAYQTRGVQKMTGYGAYASKTKMTGFGSTQAVPKSIGSQFSEGLSSFMDKLLIPKDKKETYKQQAAVLRDSLPQYVPVTIKKPVAQETQFQPVGMTPPLQSMLPLRSSATLSRRTKKHIPGKPGGGWDDDDNDEVDVSRKDDSTSTRDLSEFSECQESEVEGLSCEEWIEEEKLVESFAVDLPLSKITCDQMTDLQRKCSNLNCDKVIEISMNRILPAAKAEVMALRCLYLLEYFLLNDVINPESLERIASSALDKLSTTASEASIRAKAKKLYLMNKRLLKQQELLKHKSSPC